jgi:DNA-binding beta-propeller fold protein YncE
LPAGGRPIIQSTVTLWAATSGEPAKVAETESVADGRFALKFERMPTATPYYLVAQGGRALGDSADRENTAIRMLAVLGTNWPSKVTINELTTVASVWTSAQFITGTRIAGKPIGVQIAAGNVANFVDIRTGGYGAAIQDPLNGPQTPTLANFATLGDLLAGCITRVTTTACASLFAAATPPAGSPVTNTLDVAESIARNSWYQPAKVFALLDTFYPIPPGKTLRNVPFAPYLSFAPSAWILALQFDGGGYRAGGKLMFDSHGNAWVPDNFTVGFQGQDTLWQGNLSEFAPNGEALSPITTGFTGGGFEGGSFGGAIDSKDRVWVDSYGGKSISVFDNRGKPLTPASGITFGGQLGLMQGIIVMPGSGDVWALGITKNQLVYFPKGDYEHGRIVCEGTVAEPCKSMAGPFHLAVDQQNRIWVSNGIGNFVTRFAAADPTKAVKFETGGFSESGLNIDSQGNVWVTNRLAGTPAGASVMRDMITTLKSGGNFDEVLTKAMAAGASGGGSVTAFGPDGTQLPGSPFTGPSLSGPWAIAIDGNDQVWVSNFAHPWGQLAHLCGVRTATCPPGAKTGDPISPPLGFVGGGLQMVTDLGIDPAGDVWENNNWQHIDQCFQTPPLEPWSTRCGGQGVTVFYGLAKPVRAPQIGPNRPL